MKEMTERQHKVYDFIKGYIIKNGYPPTVREIAGGFKISIKGAYDHLKSIERKGFLKTTSSRSRAIELHEPIIRSGGSSINVPLVGNVAAGMPILAEQNIEESYTMPTSLFGTDDLFALRVRGDSMKDVGIFDGDLALIKPHVEATNGEIVVAMLDDEATIKTFYKENGKIRLQPENPDYKPIITDTVKIIGKPVWILRHVG